MYSAFVNYFDLSLLAGGLIAFVSGSIVIASDPKKPLSWAWFLLNISSAIWSLGYMSMLLSQSREAGMISNWVLHYAAIFIPIFYFLFILALTESLQKHKIFLFGASLCGLFFLSINHTALFIKDVIPKYIFDYVCDAGPLYIYFTIYFFLIVLYAWTVLWEKIKTTTGTERARLKFVLGSSIFGFIGGGSVFFLTFNIYIPPYPIILFSIYPIIITYAILRHKLFNAKVVSTEFFVFVLWTFILFRTILSENTVDRVLNFSLLLLTVAVGIFLVRSVVNEVSQREKIEKLADDLGKANDQLGLANEKLKELDKQKTEFVSIAAHQLRSPLTAIKGYSSMLLEGSFGKVVAGKPREAIQVIFESSNKLAHVIEDFLNVTRIELGKMHYDMTTFDLAQMAQSVVNELKPNISRRGLTVNFSSDPGPLNVTGDTGKISQVLSNIIDNAVKYTKEGGLSVSVTRRQEGGKTFIRFASKDTGIGLDKETIPKLFEKFIRADGAGQINVTGTGLGLYVAKQIVEGHSGKIWAESEGKGKGSTFIVEMEETKGTDKPVSPEAQVTQKAVGDLAKAI